MSSPAKIAANRRNARKSTGPRTQEGKARSRRNALRHGLAARTLIFPAAEDEAEFSAFAADLHADLAPEGAVEAALAQRVILCAWRLEQVAKIEADLLDGEARLTAREAGIEAAPIGVWPAEMAQIARYEAALDRAFGRASKMFRERQEARLAGRLPDALEIAERSQIVVMAAPPAPLPPALAAADAAEEAETAERSQGEADAPLTPEGLAAERSQGPANGAAIEIERLLDARFARARQIAEEFRRAP